MKMWRKVFASILSFVIVVQVAPRAVGCGPENVEPVFVFTKSPDLPFEEFAQGKIGILQPTFGRKTLVIAYRYLNGGTFTADEQSGLVEALKGKAPEADDGAAIKAWITSRKEIAKDETQQPPIYDERQHGGYDFFPNCTKNAFEVAIETLKDRVARFGAENHNVLDWLQGQDTVFRNCAQSSSIPAELGPVSPTWLRKDRDYQIAASFFYSLKFPEARARFEMIAHDNESDWQKTAEYLVGRTLVREASLSPDDKSKRALYEQAETYLANLLARGGKFQNASRKLLALVKFRLRPEERVRELGQILAEQSGNENLRQDLIDYSWLLDKFDEQAQKAEEERQKQLQPAEPTATPYFHDQEYREKYEAVERGELIALYFSPKKADGEADYRNSMTWHLKYDVSEADIFRLVEEKLNRKLTPEEAKDLKTQHASALSTRQWNISPNRRWDRRSEYEGCDYQCNELTLNLIPEFLRTDPLSDWVFTLQSKDPAAYQYAFSKWRLTQAPVWLATALTKAEKNSPAVERLMREGEKIQPDAPAYPSVAYQLVRLRVALNKKAEARKLLDEIISSQVNALPISAQNQFLEQRMQLAESLSDFLKYAGRKPVAFYEYGSYGKISDLMRAEKEFRDPEHSGETKEDYEQKVEDAFKELLQWDDRVTFDYQTVDVLNTHFPLAVLLEASRHPALPDYLQRRMLLSVWTRAILLKNEQVARSAAADVVKLAPEMSAAVTTYLNAETSEGKDNAALYVLLKFPDLTPFVPAGVPDFTTAEDSDYYFETAWWCQPSETEHNDEGIEVPKIVAHPAFLSQEALRSAQGERVALSAIGDGKKFLGKKVVEWAKRSPDDPRVPEALFIAAKANKSYKYGCGGWEQDEETRVKLETILRERYPWSPWTLKLADGDN